jgi:periplasmic divalent cation tolerance protein
MTDKIVVFSTCANEAEADNLARMLVEARLAACVNVVPGVRSFYRWQGALEQSDECLLIIKSSRALFEDLRLRLAGAHSYELPETVAIPIVEGSPAYLRWIDQNLGSVADE